MQWAGTFFNNAIFGPTLAKWSPGAHIATGLAGGPLVFFDAATPNAAVFAPMTNFMGANLAQDAAGNVLVGMLGSFTALPAGSGMTSLLWYALLYFSATSHCRPSSRVATPASAT